MQDDTAPLALSRELWGGSRSESEAPVRGANLAPTTFGPSSRILVPGLSHVIRIFDNRGSLQSYQDYHMLT